MVEYNVDYSIAFVVARNALDIPQQNDSFEIVGPINNMEEAALQAVDQIDVINATMIGRRVWGGTIRGKGQEYKIIEDGKWLVDKTTGKRKSQLETAAKENQ